MNKLNDKLYASILVDIKTESLNKPFIYVVPDSLKGVLQVGDKVIFPFGRGNKEKEGFVIELLSIEALKNKNFYKKDIFFKDEKNLENLKSIISKASNKTSVKEILLKLALFMSRKYYAPLVSSVNATLPVKKVVRKNIRQVDAINKYESDLEYNVKDEDFTKEQNKVISDILGFYKKNEFSEHLIYGITGSGKTEVYIKIIEKVLLDKKKVIVLIPEIALTHQTVIRLKEKFDKNISIIHSRMSDGDKYIQYNKCESGETDILVGPRSVVFAPFDNLGLVIIDEVHDTSYKSELSPRYNTLEVARFRCKEQNATLITLSATPSIDLYYYAKEKKLVDGNNINLHKLPLRVMSTLPKVYLVDMKKEYENGNKSVFSNLLIEKIRDRLNKKEQVMLYMNRRGYNTIFTCKSCGKTYECPHCEVALVSHNNGKLKCHYCGYEMDEPLNCNACGSDEIEKYGLGTEKLEEICIDLFPDARVLRMDKDTTSLKDGHDKIIEKFRKGDADILIGTQMIVKGHDFKNVTLVGIMRADLSLYATSYKASEMSFDIITQCVGRSGRKTYGEAVIQSFDTDSYVMKLALEQDFEKFYEEEIKFRKKLLYPPFSKLLYINIQSKDIDFLTDLCNNLKVILEKNNNSNSTILGPTNANPEKINDVYYKVIMIKCNLEEEAFNFRRLSYKFYKYMDKFSVAKISFDIE